MLESMRFWLDRGVDGFRMDVIWYFIKDDQFRGPIPSIIRATGPMTPRLLPTYTTDRPEVHDMIITMRSWWKETRNA